MSMKKVTLFGMLLLVILSGCSTTHKARREERDRVASSRGLFCDFVSESDYKDVDIELNLRLAKKCNANKPFSISGYKRVSENPGVLYCCNTEGVADTDTPAVKPAASQSTTPSATK